MRKTGRLGIKAVISRQKNKTDFIDRKLSLGDSVGKKRRRETFETAKEIHGGTKRAASVGLINTILNRSSDNLITDMLCKKSKLAAKVAAKVYKKDLACYENCNENMYRSVAVYYGGNVMGKRKYRKLYRDSAFKSNNKKLQTTLSIANCPVPRFVPYNKLMPFIKSINIGTLYNVQDTLCEGSEKVSGCYRNLEEILLILAKFYLSKSSGYERVWFSGETNTFYVALGGDGAPFGKDDTSSSWLISFLNIGRGVISSNKNY